MLIIDKNIENRAYHLDMDKMKIVDEFVNFIPLFINKIFSNYLKKKYLKTFHNNFIMQN